MSSTRLNRSLALALAGGSLAIGVPAALAASGGDDPAPGSAPIQQQQSPDRPDRGDCPEHDGGGGAGGGGDAAPGQGTGATGTPSV